MRISAFAAPGGRKPLALRSAQHAEPKSHTGCYPDANIAALLRKLTKFGERRQVPRQCLGNDINL